MPEQFMVFQGGLPLYVFSAVLGLVTGSFANVCIYRLPREKSVVTPPSSCPSCGKQIKPWDNIPLLSYLFLRGRCRACGQPISPRYPLVEALNGLLYFLVAYRYGLTPATLFYFVFAIREYDTSMHFFFPFSPYMDKSARRLWQIGEMFENRGQLDWAEIAYQSLRSSFYAVRSFYTPGKDWINRCDDKIADLNVKSLIKDGSLKPEDAQAERAKHMMVLKTDRAPSVFWSVLAEIGFFGWAGSALFTALRGVHQEEDTGRAGAQAKVFPGWKRRLPRRLQRGGLPARPHSGQICRHPRRPVPDCGNGGAEGPHN